MALKDWKRTTNQKYKIVYKNKDRNFLIGISPDFIFTSNGQKVSKWNVQIHNLNSMALDYSLKKFKTKSQALKYARAYMRKH